MAVQEHLNYQPTLLEGHGFIGGEGEPGSSRSRRNLGLYYDLDLPEPTHYWIDLEGTWARTAKNAKGAHEPRSILVAQFGDLRVIVAHMPPQAASEAVRVETWHMVQTLLASGSDTLLMWDGNDRRELQRGGPLTTTNLARTVGGIQHGSKVDAAVTRGDITRVGSARYIPAPGDHGHVLDVTFQVPVTTLWPLP